MKKRMIVTSLLFSLLLLSHLAWTQNKIPKVVSTDWLRENLAKEDLRLIDTRVAVADYWQGHIPGAVYLNIETLRMANQGIPAMLHKPEVLKLIFANLGISEKNRVLIYSEYSDFKATYVGWALDCVGFANWGVLDGGYNRWTALNLQTNTVYPRIALTFFGGTTTFVKSAYASWQDVKAALGQENTLVLDTRPSNLFRGEKGSLSVPGRIKGTINAPWRITVKSDGTFLEKGELEKYFATIGVSIGKHVITTCGQGLLSAHAYFVLRYLLGLENVQNYDGGLNEWASHPELPIEVEAK